MPHRHEVPCRADRLRRHAQGTGSVQEAVQDLVMPHVRADSCKFQTAGREDIDVRMLGQGRPFIMEFFNPRRVVADTAFWQGQADQLASAGKGVSAALGRMACDSAIDPALATHGLPAHDPQVEIIGLQAVGRDTSCVMKVRHPRSARPVLQVRAGEGGMAGFPVQGVLGF